MRSRVVSGLKLVTTATRTLCLPLASVADADDADVEPRAVSFDLDWKWYRYIKFYIINKIANKLFVNRCWTLGTARRCLTGTRCSAELDLLGDADDEYDAVDRFGESDLRAEMHNSWHFRH